MIFGIVGVVEFDVVTKKQPASWMVGEPAMHERLRK
jgi:hypothetical protein